jgi:hypothetical protein
MLLPVIIIIIIIIIIICGAGSTSSSSSSSIRSFNVSIPGGSSVNSDSCIRYNGACTEFQDFCPATRSSKLSKETVA